MCNIKMNVVLKTVLVMLVICDYYEQTSLWYVSSLMCDCFGEVLCEVQSSYGSCTRSFLMFLTWSACTGVLVYANAQIGWLPANGSMVVFHVQVESWDFFFDKESWDLEPLAEPESRIRSRRADAGYASLQFIHFFLLLLFLVLLICSEFWGLVGII
jgi:hypothetical protein